MKLIRAKFENFRLLRDLELDFSIDNKGKLTVVRAENESGKTTILNALQWGFYGDNALPGKGKNYRLHPLDWNTSESRQIPISVQIDFEIINSRQSRSGELIETPEQYRIIRSTYETLNGIEHERSEPIVRLFQLTDEGSVTIEFPEALIRETLPLELREVFFTDGDRTLSFIETESVTAKRKLVKEAIQSLLGLKVIENALRHVGNTASKANKDAKKIGSDEELTTIVTELEQLGEDIKILEKKRDEANLQFTEFDQKCTEIDQQIKAALSKGNRDELKHDIEQAKTHLKQVDNQRSETSKAHSELFENLSLSRDLLAPVLEKSLGKLNELRDQGKLPSTTIPVLEERLTAATCICGESLDPHKPNNKHRRDHIERLIKESRKADKIQSSLTDLYFASRSLKLEDIANADRWSAKYAEIAEHRDELEKVRKELGEKFKALEAKLDNIPDTNIHKLRETEQTYIAQRDRFNTDRTKYEIQLESLKEKSGSLAATRNNLLKKQRRGTRTLARLEVTRDIKQILQNSYNRITNEELNKVSDLMNELFLKMIRADQKQKQRAIICKAEITKEYDILVYGLGGKLLHTKDDLNGASRRALTLAFILALTKVSEVEAPNVIDTPLGAMSGDVKESVLKTAISESSQLILFLTRAEIRDCETIIDDEAGRVMTLTNSAHYPEMVLNDPEVEALKVLRCECNHHRRCKICTRRRDVQSKTTS